MLAENPRAVIGGNSPPEPTAFEKAEKEVADLYDEARLWLDGKPIESQAQADGLSNLLNMLRAAEKRADEARKVEKEPHAAAAKAVDTRFRPILMQAERAIGVCKTALGKWLVKLDEEKRAAAEKAREEAEQAAWLAQDAMQTADATDLEARAEAEVVVIEAKRAERVAKRAANDTAQAKGGIGRAVSLRTSYRPEFTDPDLAVKHYWATERDEVCALLLNLAERDVRLHGKREIPGFVVIEEKTAV